VLRLPIAVGLKVMLTMQLAPAASPAPPMGHGVLEVDNAKSLAFPPVSPMVLMINTAFPVLVSVRVCGVVVVPTVMLTNWKALLLGLMIGAMPLPVKGTDNAVGFELAMLIVAVRGPEAMGLKVTVIVQLKPAAKLVAQVVVFAKSPAFTPVSAMPVMASVPAPVALVKVTTCEVLVVFTNWSANDNGVGDTFAFAAVPTAATLDHPEDRPPRIEAFQVWDRPPAQPLSMAWTR